VCRELKLTVYGTLSPMHVYSPGEIMPMQ
jgi:hypothetical protein